ncbi:MAG: NO-inducible flavohemoprotein, partial [Aeromonas sobria]
FYLKADGHTPVVLLSAGVGVTPMMSMLNQLLTIGHQTDITWLHACEQGAVHAFREDIRNKRSQYTNLVSRVWYREPEASDVQVEDYDLAGTMDLAAVKERITPEAHYYFCGPLGFMQEIKRQLLAVGVPAGQLHYEVFGPHQDL